MVNAKTAVNRIRGLFLGQPNQASGNIISPQNRDATQRGIVARFSRGNARLQQGQFITREEIDEQLEQGLEDARKYND